MGYFVQITDSSARIPAANLQRAYEKMCALNVTHDAQKRGGSYERGVQTARWFSWMDANYPETCKDAQAILEQLGFETEYAPNGDLLILGYDNKRGQEELFLLAIDEETIGTIRWVGEEGESWETIFAGGDVIEGTVVRPALTAQ